MDLRIALQPKQKQFLQRMEDTSVTFYGGAKGGGKSKGLRSIFLLRRFKYEGSHGAIFRRTYSELEGNHIRPLFEEFPVLRPYWHEGKKLLGLPNGSTLQFCHCNNEPDVDLYQGREFHDLGIDEAGQWTESMFRKLSGSNRSSKEGISPRCALTGNPGGIGHTWLKRIFIEKRFNPRERPGDYAFIQALVDDNPALIDNDPDYVHKLEAEPNEALRKAYRFGDWDIFAGQFFGELRREIHFIPAFQIPPHWTRFGAYDFGFNHPAAFGWFACDEDGNVYLYRELVKAQLRVDQFSEAIKRYPETQSLSTIVAGHDCWTKKNVLKQGSAPTIAEEFLEHGITLTRAKIDRIQGASQVRSYLAWQSLANGRNKPRFYILDSCPHSFGALSRMLVDPDRLEDVLKQDATEGEPDTGDDAYDMIRYGLMSRPMLAEPIKNPIKHGSVEWLQYQSKRMSESIDAQAIKQEQDEKEREWFEMSAEGVSQEDAIAYHIRKRAR
jgi:phage terminase large subunit